MKTYILGVDTIDAGKPKTIEGKNTNNKIIIPIVAIAIVAVSIVAYQYLQPSTQVNINGSGATFPQPLLNAMIPAYKNLKTNVVINYQGIGSGGGISALQGKTVDFAGSDAPLSATERNLAPNSLHIPETIGAVTIAYNIPNIPSGMHLTGQVIADIFAGNITTWNNAAIQNLNPNMTLPSNSIFTVHRSDGSGTTFVFTGYLSKVSAGWNHTIGQAKSVSWPVGVGASGNTGVATAVTQTQYSIGYVELAYALQSNMKVAAVQNPTGNWILPTLATTQAAAQSGAQAGLPTGSQSWTTVNLLNQAGEQSYPIVTFTYILVYKELNVIPDMTQNKATQIVQFLWWMVHDGQQSAAALQYAALPNNVVQIDEATIRSITFNSQSLPVS